MRSKVAPCSRISNSKRWPWAFTSRHIIYLQDKNGDENWRIFCAILDSGEIKDLTPFDGVRSQILALSPKFPKEAIVGLNKRDPEYHDLFRLNIETDELTAFLENREFAGFDIDDNFHLRMASKMTADGGTDGTGADQHSAFNRGRNLLQRLHIF